jgi:hypothetical protein
MVTVVYNNIISDSSKFVSKKQPQASVLAHVETAGQFVVVHLDESSAFFHQAQPVRLRFLNRNKRIGKFSVNSVRQLRRNPRDSERVDCGSFLASSRASNAQSACCGGTLVADGIGSIEGSTRKMARIFL